MEYDAPVFSDGIRPQVLVTDLRSRVNPPHQATALSHACEIQHDATRDRHPIALRDNRFRVIRLPRGNGRFPSASAGGQKLPPRMLFGTDKILARWVRVSGAASAPHLSRDEIVRNGIEDVSGKMLSDCKVYIKICLIRQIGLKALPWRSTERDLTCSTMIPRGMRRSPHTHARTGERAVNYQ